MVPRPQFPPRDNAGLTIVELVAVLCVGGVVVAIVMLSLAFMTRQTLVQRHMAAFQAQTSRAVSAIADEIRQGSQVVRFDRNSVTFVGAAGDTVTYCFRNDSLKKNGGPPGPAFDSIRVAAFTVEAEDTSAGQQEATFVLTLGTRDRIGHPAEIHNRVHTRYLPDTVAGATPR
ncbi:MAG TPA: hypothetical protein VKF42_02835 [Chitinivibrionales bacterium]|jgi:Tfp pilus assembly protein PilE|nr:hypothetical protein [Chitinivibrionales bacterium]